MDVLITTCNGQTIIENVEEISITSEGRALEMRTHEDEFGWGWNVTECEPKEVAK